MRYITENGKKTAIKDMVEVSKFGPMEVGTKDTGKKINIQMEMYTKVNGSRIKHMDMAFIHISMELSTKVIGKKINRMEMEKKVGRTVPRMKVIINRVKKADKENSNGLMEVLMKDNLKIIILMEKVYILGEIKDNILGTMDMVYSNGPMEKNIKDIGLMENRMVKGNSIMTKLKRGEDALFKMEEESNGSMNK